MSANLVDIELAGLSEEQLRAALAEQHAVTACRWARLAVIEGTAETVRVNGCTWDASWYERMSERRLLVRYGERQLARIGERLRRIEEQRAYDAAVERARRAR